MPIGSVPGLAALQPRDLRRGRSRAVVSLGALRDEFSGLAGIDRQLGALKLSRGIRGASKMTGAALIAAGRDIFEPPQISRLAEMIELATARVIMRWSMARCPSASVSTEHRNGDELPLERIVQPGRCRTAAGAARAKRGPAHHRRRWPPDRSLFAEIARMGDLQSMSASLAALDVASMRHERLHTRLCIS